MRFSERIGVTQPVLSLQLESISVELRNSLWNLFLELYDGKDGQWKKIAVYGFY